MDLSASTPFDLAILASADCFVHSKIKRRKNREKPDDITDVFLVSGCEEFSSTSSNGSTTSPVPMNLKEQPKVTRAHSVAPSIVRSKSDYEHRKLQKSTSELAIKTSSEYWLKVVPSCKVRPRNCDEVPEEFRRAGIGLCFGGKNGYFSSPNCLKKDSKCRIRIFQSFSPNSLLKLTCLVTLFDHKLQFFAKIAKLTIFGIFNELLSTQNVARFARNVE